MSGKTSDTARPDTTRLQRTAKAYWETGALFAAIDLEAFTLIDRGHDTVAKLGDAAGIGALNAERLLDALAGMELVHRSPDGIYTNAADVDRFLVKDRRGYAGEWMTFMREKWGDWNRMAEIMREADPGDRLGMYEDLTEEGARKYHAATYSIGMGAARKFHREVDLSNRRKIMDLGGGSGAYCINAASKYPDIAAIVLDLPPVVPVARDYVAENGMSDRVTAKACDFTADPLPGGCDVAIQASNLPIYDRPVMRALVKKIFDALEPGGEYHLIGEMVNNDRMGPIAPALWGLYEAIPRSVGHAHSIEECEGYLADAGFERISVAEFIPGTLTRVTGYKPG
ncbi:methyltransferase [Minwuia sp.]|uniref:methyltransferase n=1 Tax=Minwuia sp. TaxID=2493630 RepID=UPI003A95DF80